MQDNNIREKCRELATRLYELDGEVYESVGSSLGRTFTGDREGTIRNLSSGDPDAAGDFCCYGYHG